MSPKFSDQVAQNWLLRFVQRSAARRDPLRPEPVDLAQGAVLSPHGGKLSHVYFPSTCVLSMLAISDTSVAVETAMIGRESAFGLLAGLSNGETVAQCTVQVPGQTLRVSLDQFARIFESRNSVRSLRIRANQVPMAQAQQSVLCRAIHSSRCRLSRFLLMLHDRAGAGTFSITQEFMAAMLAADRTTRCRHGEVRRRLSGYLRWRSGRRAIRVIAGALQVTRHRAVLRPVARTAGLPFAHF
jgi:CRP-like cAMP-binding protein